MTTSIDQVLDPEYLGEITARPITEIREMRGECQRLEVDLSYLRRLVQGRLDIVGAELQRRSEGEPPTDLAALVERLPEILGEHVHAPGLGRLPTYLAPSDDAELTTELDAIVDSRTLGALPDLDEDAVRGIADRLAELERELSDQRRTLHDRIDALQGELTRRYKTGEATVESLLQ